MRLALLLACSATAFATDKWKVQYFHDEDKSSLRIVDLKCPSAQRCVAICLLSGTDQYRTKPVALVTSDGGVKWSQVPLPQPGLSLFFLNETLGWMVSPKDLWVTEESGRSWRKLKAPDGLLSVHFADPSHGWAVGARKQFYESRDGGRTWQKVSMATEVAGNPEYTHFSWVGFATPDVGMIAGWSRPPRRREMFTTQHPSWLDPESAVERRQWPTMSIVIETKDAGKKWTAQASSLFGRISKFHLSPEGWGVGLLEYDDSFDYPSEVVAVSWRTGQSRSAYRQKDRKITDLAAGGPAGPIYLGAVEVLGKLNQAAIPGKVKIIRTFDARTWSETEVDYRAVARRVVVATAGAEHAWAATDTGMILKLSR